MRHAHTPPFTSPNRAPPPSPQPPHPPQPPLLHENYLSSNPISLQLEPSPTASRRISSGCTLHPLRQMPSPVASSYSSVSPSPTPTPATRPSSPEQAEAEKLETEKERNPEPEPELDKDKETGATAKKRKMPIINPLVTLPMWPSKSPPTSATSFSCLRPPVSTSADSNVDTQPAANKQTSQTKCQY